MVDAPPSAGTPSAPLLWDEVPGNLSFRFQKGDPAAVNAAMASAAFVETLDLINNRLVIAPTETRAAIGRFENDTFHLFVTAASVHAIRDQLASGVFRLPPERVLVSAPDVGGGFGIKNALVSGMGLASVVRSPAALAARSNGSRTALRIFCQHRARP